MTDDQTLPTGAVAAPPRFADPRRMGALIGLAGAAVFVFSYTPGFGDPVSIAVRVAVIALIAATLWFLFVRPRDLGPFIPARRIQIAIYLACVVAEFALIALGTQWLVASGMGGLRPALIALVVGLHFLPFSWAFHERMFTVLGVVLVALGALGLTLGSPDGAAAAAVSSGVVMGVLLLVYSLGGFARRR